MDLIIKGKAKGLRGELEVPGDKSISHRSIMLGALARGDTLISGILMSEDVKMTIKAFKNMGVIVNENCGKIIIKGVGEKGLKKPNGIINCGNSGTTMRLLSGILVGQEFSSILMGDKSLTNRPMDRIIIPLTKMGASIKGRENKYPPLEIKPRSKLKGINYQLPVASAQVKSAILLASLYAEGESRIMEGKVTRDHTERMLNFFGCPVINKEGQIFIKSNPGLVGKEIHVPGDISSAAYFIVAATLINNSNIIIRNVGINPTRTGIINVLKKMGANIKIFNKKYVNNEPVADIQVTYSKLKGIIIDGDIVGTLIDEIPIIAVAASLASGKTIIKGAEELKYKESNRIISISRELKKMGANILEQPDGMIIEGKSSLKAADLNSYNDHRIAMALSIASLLPEGKSRINDHECVNVSYPDFYHTLFQILS
ncbi:3-phosphoshikimate 1-carboxyvinyltransferase [Clostridium sp. Cult1]|uniref:3-phosphoshikimate 1-carboxyvinyltransferase n=1 Tax=Clostridium sp. Cult1 TaxID=2079002 RepID=UPI001EFFE93E|nr:3-phosphoshikimate 1-carboxyvinyltransferase [Clostridium sp. Cult1]MCF6464080.1 3-phosphoshikimate 1-carboxyvinyltransferase [Clostridium sp. Cult1]